MISNACNITATVLMAYTNESSAEPNAENNTNANAIEKVVEKLLWEIFAPTFLCFGVLGNTLTLLVIRRMKLKKRPTLLFILFLAITETVNLLTGLPRQFIWHTFEYDIGSATDINCKLYEFFIYFSFHYSSWILVWITLERLVKTYFPLKYRRLCNNIKVTVLLLLTMFVLILLDGEFFFTNGVNNYTKNGCGSMDPDLSNFDMHVYVYIDFCVYSLVPMLIMSVSNVLLIRILLKVQRNRASMMDSKAFNRSNRFSVRMTKMLLVCTLYFIITTVPNCIYLIVSNKIEPGLKEKNDTVALARLNLFGSITYIMSFSNSCLDFYLYTAMNSRFRAELMLLLKCKLSLRETEIYIRQRHSQTSSRRRPERSMEANSQGTELSSSGTT